MTEAVFRAKAPVLMTRLLNESFGFTVEDVAAIAGNGGHESGGFTAFQEIKPTVAGSKGGWGWFQWTGPRRRAFDRYCEDYKLAKDSDAAQIGFLIYELKTTERAAIAKTKAAKDLQAKVIAFELGYERAGVKHYPSRLRWAQIALEAYQKAQAGKPAPIPPPPDIPAPEPAPEPVPAPQPNKTSFIVAVVLALGGAAAYFKETAMSYLGPLLVLAGLGAFGYFLIWPKIKARFIDKKEGE